MALGEYLGIVETDDYIAENMYEVLYKAASKEKLDFVKAGFDAFVTPGEGERYQLKVSMADCNQIISSDYFTEKELSMIFTYGMESISWHFCGNFIFD